MKQEELLLIQLGEECAEVVQEISKCIRFGLNEVYAPAGITNIERVERELNDVISLISILRANAVLTDAVFDPVRTAEKKRKVQQMLQYSKDCGRLT